MRTQNRNPQFDLQIIENPRNLSDCQKEQMLTQMMEVTKKAWGDPKSLLNQWIGLADILAIAYQGGIKGFAVGKKIRNNLYLFPATIVHPDSQQKGLGVFMNINILSRMVDKDIIGKLKYFYIVFRTPNPIFYHAISKVIDVVPAIDGRAASLEETSIAKEIANIFSPECKFDVGNFIIEGALKPFPDLIYTEKNIPWARSEKVNRFFSEKMRLPNGNGNELVIVGKIPMEWVNLYLSR